MSATKSTGDYWKRLSHDPHFAREMSERQQSLGGIYAKQEADSDDPPGEAECDTGPLAA